MNNSEKSSVQLFDDFNEMFYYGRLVKDHMRNE